MKKIIELDHRDKKIKFKRGDEPLQICKSSAKAITTSGFKLCEPRLEDSNRFLIEVQEKDGGVEITQIKEVD